MCHFSCTLLGPNPFDPTQALITEAYAGEQPVCSFGPKDWAGQTVCRVDRVKKRMRDFCEGSGTKCPRYSEFEALDVQVRLFFLFSFVCACCCSGCGELICCSTSRSLLQYVCSCSMLPGCGLIWAEEELRSCWHICSAHRLYSCCTICLADVRA